MGKLIDITGQRFGRLVVIQYMGQDSKRKSLWKCQCDCGGVTIVPKCNLINGNTKSCGCLGQENLENIGKDNKKYNKYELFESYGVGYTSNNTEFYFDLEDYNKIKDYCWIDSNSGYIVSYESKNKNIIYLHKFVMDTEQEVDHRDRRKNNARKSNLRICTHSENMRNVGIKQNNNSGIIGVFYDKTRDKWVSSIDINKQNLRKRFANKQEAIKQRLVWEAKYFGEFAPQQHLFEQYGIKIDMVNEDGSAVIRSARYGFGEDDE